MTLEIWRGVLLWCTILNSGMLLAWFALFAGARGFIYRMHSRWFNIPEERFDGIHYRGMMVYKIGIIFFNLIPYLALLIMSRT
jgi:hypothetical protein